MQRMLRRAWTAMNLRAEVIRAMQQKSEVIRAISSDYGPCTHAAVCGQVCANLLPPLSGRKRSIGTEQFSSD